jgi:hypothetical protein
VKIQLWRRRRLGNFKNFVRLGGGLEILKILSVSAAARLYLFLISGGGSEI